MNKSLVTRFVESTKNEISDTDWWSRRGMLILFTLVLQLMSKMKSQYQIRPFDGRVIDIKIIVTIAP